jgi:hypothetical protein
MSSGFKDIELLCTVNTPSCTNPEANALVTVKETAFQFNACEACFNYMVENKKWTRSTWESTYGNP